jgi:hypothetical protein
VAYEVLMGFLGVGFYETVVDMASDFDGLEVVT